MPVHEITMEELVSLCKTRGIIYAGSEIYGGLANTWDYGPIGVELLRNVKKAFWDFFVYGREDIVGLDSSILLNPKVWEASGHIASFTDPLMDCKKCKARYRADKLIEEAGDARPEGWAGEKTDKSAIVAFVKEKKITCPSCKACDWTEPKQFNLMFRTHQGVTEESSAEIFMRPETAQGIFVNFVNAQRTSRKKLPFGIAQIGKAFRNEITPGNFIFRTREFEQMEIEYFFDPEKSQWEELFQNWKKAVWDFVTKELGIGETHLRMRDHEKDELSHYSKGTTDIEYEFPFGWGELCAAAAYRTDYDLTQHQKTSGESLEYRDEESGRKFIPHVIEPSLGANRLVLAILLDAYTNETLKDGTTRNVMRFSPKIAPIKVAVFPLMKKDGLDAKAREVVRSLRSIGRVDYDEAGSIGKRYRRHDEVGTPACITIDYDSLKDKTVTVRDRDTMEQERVNIADLPAHLRGKYHFD